MPESEKMAGNAPKSADDDFAVAVWEMRCAVQEAARDSEMSALIAYNVGYSLGTLSHLAANLPDRVPEALDTLRAQVENDREVAASVRKALSANLEDLRAAWERRRSRDRQPL